MTHFVDHDPVRSSGAPLALYGHWQKQRDHATRLAAAAQAYPRPGRSRTIAPVLPDQA
jgi:hypothetical protein